MKKKLYLVGALTSKPYAFTARSWELKNTDSLDVFDSIGSNIKISTRGSSILRILPKVNEKINEEWITDKARFSYDALKFQRILHCYKKNNSSFIKLNWPKIFGYLYHKTKSVEFYGTEKNSNDISLNFFVGSFVDLETLHFIKNFEFSIKCNMFSIINSSVPAKINFDFRSNYLFKNDLDIEELDNLLLIGCNPRLEAPAFNLRIRKNVLFKNLQVLNIGFNSALTYKIKNLGSGIKKFLKLIEGKSAYSKFIVGNKNFLLVYGMSFFHIAENVKIYEYSKCLLKNAVVLPAESSTINFFEIGFVNKLFWSEQKNVQNINWLVDEDKSIFFKKNRFNIYSGHHGDLNFKKSDMILPSTLFSEKNSTYLNYQGYVQRTKFVDSSLLGKDVRDDLVLMKTFLKKKHIPHGYSINKQLSSYDIENDVKNNLFFVYNNNVHYYMKDFYRNDSISRNSPIMALTSNRLRFKKSSFSVNKIL